MKLYEVPNNSIVRLLDDLAVPPFSTAIKPQQILRFIHVDGLYSLCRTMEGNIVHPAAWTEVEIVTQDSLDKKE